MRNRPSNTREAVFGEHNVISMHARKMRANDASAEDCRLYGEGEEVSRPNAGCRARRNDD